MEDYKLIVLIPAYEPNEKLIDLVKKIGNENLEIVVVDDGSKKGFQHIFKEVEKDAYVIHHDINRGKGRALKTGFKYIKDNYQGKYIVITLDCDGQHKLDDAMKLFNYNIKHPDDLVLGSRGFDKNVPLRSMLGNTITRHIFEIVSGVKIYDTQTGLRSFSNNLIDEMLEIKGERFEYEINVLLKLAKEGVNIKEITIETIYLDNNSGSHFNAIKDSFKIYKEIFKFSLSSLSSFIVDYIFYTIFVILFSSANYGLQLANIFARLISATFNFFVNRNYVFKKKNNLLKEVLLYTILAIIILLFNTIILSVFVNEFGVNQFVSKVLTEVVLFIASYLVQHFFIFRRDDD